MKKYEDPKMELLELNEVLTEDPFEEISNDDETQPGGFGPLIG